MLWHIVRFFFLLYKCSILLRLWVSTYQVAVMYSRKVHSGTASPSGKEQELVWVEMMSCWKSWKASSPACLVSLSLCSFLLSRKGEGGRRREEEGEEGGGREAAAVVVCSCW